MHFRELGEGSPMCSDEVGVFRFLRWNVVVETLCDKNWDGENLVCFGVGRLARYFFCLEEIILSHHVPVIT